MHKFAVISERLGENVMIDLGFDPCGFFGKPCVTFNEKGDAEALRDLIREKGFGCIVKQIK